MVLAHEVSPSLLDAPSGRFGSEDAGERRKKKLPKASSSRSLPRAAPTRRSGRCSATPLFLGVFVRCLGVA